jgi:hypothetical protein
VPPHGVPFNQEPTVPARRKRQPIAPSLELAYVISLAVALLMAAVSTTGLLLGPGGLYGEPSRAVGITESTSGLLIPGFLSHDAFNLVVGVPLLLGVVWLARRGWLAGLLLWPGVLFYILYTYSTYLLGATFGPLFLPHVALVALSAYTVVVVVASIDGATVRDRLAPVVPARVIGGLLLTLGALTLAQDGSAAVATALTGTSLADPPGRHIWTVDLTVEVPALLIGGVLLWRRAALGYVVAAGLLLQFGLTPLALAAILGFQPLLTGAGADVGTIVGVLVFAFVCYVPLAYLLRRLGSVAPAVVAKKGASHV